jgi:glycosyltransferase involved in cell wall biosynthesis
VILLFFRKPNREKGNSIEQLFDYYLQVSNNIKRIELPNYIHSLKDFFYNLYFFYVNQTEINHITGDCYYLALGLKSKNKLIITYHDCVILENSKCNKLKYYFFYVFWFKIPLYKADTVIAISQKTINEIHQFTNFPKSKIQLIPNYVNPAFNFNVNSLAKNTKPVILQVGVKENKNLITVCKAISSEDYILRIIGKLEEKDLQILELFKINYENFNNISTIELAELYKTSDLLTFISTYEGFGMPIIEAQSSGLPLITSNISPMKDIAGKGAILVNPFDVNEVKREIINILNDKVKREILIQCGFENCKKYSFDHFKNEYNKVYQCLQRN